MKPIKAPKLKRIDLSKCCERPGGCGKSDHPDIKRNKTYLAKIGRSWSAGSFSREWFGWSFFDGGMGSVQLDKPGTNASQWRALFEICP